MTDAGAGHFLQNTPSPPAEPGPPHVHTFSPAGPDPEEAVKWLREQIEGDLRAAKIVGAGGFEPQRWDTDPPGQVNPAAAPFAEQVNAVLVPDPEDRRDRPGMPGWVEVVSYDRLLGEPPEADVRDDDLPVALVGDGRREVDHICRHDPRSVVADCEAKLAILDEHSPADWTAYGDQMCRRCVYDDEPERDELHHWMRWPCKTVRIVASAYRHREGYSRYWGEPVTHTFTEAGR